MLNVIIGHRALARGLIKSLPFLHIQFMERRGIFENDMYYRTCKNQYIKGYG